MKTDKIATPHGDDELAGAALRHRIVYRDPPKSNYRPNKTKPNIS